MADVTQTPDQLPALATVSAAAQVIAWEPGGPTSKVEIGKLLGRLVSTQEATATQAALYALLGYDANAIALVFADPTPANNGWYRKVGPTGAGNWSQFERLSDVVLQQLADAKAAILDPAVANARQAAADAVAAKNAVQAVAAPIANIVAAGTPLDARPFDRSGLLRSAAGADDRLYDALWAPGHDPRLRVDPYDAREVIARFVGIGNSLTEQGLVTVFAQEMAKPNRLGIAMPSSNTGLSGKTSTAINLASGAAVQLYQPTGKVVPSDTSPVTLLPSVAGPLEAYGGAGGSALGRLAGVKGTYTWAAGGPMTFARAVAGAAVGVPDPVPFEPVFHDRDSLYQRDVTGASKQAVVVDDWRRCCVVVPCLLMNDIFDPYTDTFWVDRALRRLDAIWVALTPAARRAFLIASEFRTVPERQNNTPAAAHKAAVIKACDYWFDGHHVNIDGPLMAAEAAGTNIRNDGYLHLNATGQGIATSTMADFAMAHSLYADVRLAA